MTLGGQNAPQGKSFADGVLGGSSGVFLLIPGRQSPGAYTSFLNLCVWDSLAVALSPHDSMFSCRLGVPDGRFKIGDGVIL